MNRAIRPPRGRAVPPARPLTRRQLSRHERERRQRQLVIGAVAFTLGLILLIPLVGYYREVLTKGSQPVATVHGEVISLDTYAKAYGYRLITLESQVQQMQQLAAQTTGSSNVFAQQLQRLQSQRSTLDSETLSQLIDDRLIVREAAARGISLTQAEEDAEIARQFGVPPAPTPAAATDPTPIPTIDPMERFKTVLSNIRILNETDYRTLVIRPTLLRARLESTFAQQVPATEAQVRARHILVETEAEAAAVKQRLGQGETFEALAREVSKDTSNKEQAGDLGWFGRGTMAKPFEDAAFAQEPGKVGEPVQSSFGWHIIEVLEKNDARPVEEAQRESRAGDLLRNWLEQAKETGFATNQITYELSTDKVNWARRQIERGQRP